MTLIDFGDFKIRFDPKEVRISIDGDMIDIGARKEPDNYIEWFTGLSQQDKDRIKEKKLNH
jgi:hypothetical protein